MEQWKPIPGYENDYEASNMGRIRTVFGRVTHNARFKERHLRQIILKPKACSNQYATGYRVTLWKDGKPKDFLVARLVCTTWHENLIDTKMTVNHINGNRLDNRMENLEWLTLSDNIREGFKTGLYKNVRRTVSLKRVSDGELFHFDSLRAAEDFLGRKYGYLTNAERRNYKVLKSSSGEEYLIDSIEEKKHPEERG